MGANQVSKDSWTCIASSHLCVLYFFMVYPLNLTKRCLKPPFKMHENVGLVLATAVRKGQLASVENR